MKVVAEQGCGAIVVGAKLAEVEAVHGSPVVDDGNATWPALGVFVGIEDGRVTSVAGYYSDPHEWLFGGALVPFAGEVRGVIPSSSVDDIKAAWGEPIRIDDSKPWYVLHYQGIYFTFSDGTLISWTIDPKALDDDEDDDDDDDDDW